MLQAQEKLKKGIGKNQKFKYFFKYLKGRAVVCPALFESVNKRLPIRVCLYSRWIFFSRHAFLMASGQTEA